MADNDEQSYAHLVREFSKQSAGMIRQSNVPVTSNAYWNTTAPDPQAQPLNPQHSNWNLMSSYGPQPTFDITSGNEALRFGEIGTSGLRAFSGWVREEFLPELQGRQAAQKYREMFDNSPVIGAIMYAIFATMRKVQWRVIPAGEDEREEKRRKTGGQRIQPSGDINEKCDFVQSCLHDMTHTWEDLVNDNLSSMVYGFAFHELVYKKRLGRSPPGVDANGIPLPKSEYDDGYIGWRRIPNRGQDTILKWFFDPYGNVTGVTQLPWSGVIVDIPMDKGLLFRPTPWKNNPEGKSILRSAYIPYYYSKRLREQEAILGERIGGFPVVRVPMAMMEAANAGNGKAAAALETFKRMATSMRIDEQMGALLPSDCWQGPNGPTAEKMFSVELVSPQGGGRGSMIFEPAIQRYNVEIMQSVLADFLQLGQSARGTQALAIQKVDMFFQSIEGFLNSNASIYNRYAIPRLWELNGWDYDCMPKLEPDLAQRIDLDILSNFVLRLSQAGMPIFPNEDVQTFLLDAAGLPDVSDPRALQAAGLQDEQLDLADDKAQQELEGAQTNQAAQEANMRAMQNGGATPGRPKPGSPKSNLNKMIMASIARRMIRQGGNRFEMARKNNGATHQ